MLIIPGRSGYGAFPASTHIPDTVSNAPGHFISYYLPNPIPREKALVILNENEMELYVFPCTCTIIVPQFRDLRFQCPHCTNVMPHSKNIPSQEIYVFCDRCDRVSVSIVVEKRFEPYVRPFMGNVEPLNTSLVTSDDAA